MKIVINLTHLEYFFTLRLNHCFIYGKVSLLAELMNELELNVLSYTHKNKGFTLVELMVVVAIIGILASIAIPNFQSMQLRAKRAEVPMILSGIVLAENTYFQEFGDYMDAEDQPRGPNDLNTQSVDWPSVAPGYDEIGFRPEGKVYGLYYVDNQFSTPPSFEAQGQSDVDNDDNLAIYEVTNNTRPEAQFGDAY